MKILVVGGVAAGASAAAKARRVNEDAEIIIFEKGSYVSFANCGLPYYVSGDIPRQKDLILVQPKQFKTRFNIDVRLNSEVTDVNKDARTITVASGDKTYTEQYDQLILATGGSPIKPPLPGMGLPEVYTVFTVDDVLAITENLAEKKSAVIVGGGFIGLETAEAFLKRGLKTTLVERLPQLVPNFDAEFSVPLEKHLQEEGLELVLGNSLKAVLGDGKVTGVELEDGSTITTDLVVMAIGVKPNLELAKKAGIKLGEAGGVLVNGAMRTSDKNIYAAGDIAESLHLVSRKMVKIPLAGSANKQGRVAGANAAGGKLLFEGVLGTAIIKAGELTLARTGLSEREAKAAGFNYRASYFPGYNHATYYPNAKRIILKIVFEEYTGRILGAQGVGWDGVDKRIDTLATAIYGNMTVFDLENLDLAYAPPYGSAKDPSIMSGMIAGNIIRGEVIHLTPSQLDEQRADENYLVVDLRTNKEYEAGTIEGSVHIPLDDLRERYQELDKSRKLVVFCKAGYRSYVGYTFLQHKGYTVCNLSGGYVGYTMDVNN